MLYSSSATRDDENYRPISILRRGLDSPTWNAWTIVLMAALAYLTGARCLVALSWDGSGYLFDSLQNGTPFISNYRLSNYPLLFLLVKAGRWTNDCRLLATLYGILLAVTPLGSLVLSLWLLRG